jgi:hypothetical protein
VDAIGRLTAIDGAVVLDYDLRLAGAEAIISVKPEGRVESRSILSWDEAEIVPVADLGGTRRRSAASFVLQDHNYVAVTASHDGSVSLAGWFKQTDGTLRATVVQGIEALFQ